jgi:fimbrial isopeptide formation D2 family protein
MKFLSRLFSSAPKIAPVATPMSTRPRRQHAPLEARVLFDAAGAVAAERQVDTSAQRPDDSHAQHAPTTPTEHGQDRSHLAEGAQALDAAAAQQGATVVIIDSRVQDYQALLQGVSPDAVVRIIGEHEDGLQVISDVLASVKNVDSLQIVSHGSAGMIRLGSTLVDNAALEKDAVASTIRGWQQSMTPEGDILLLGCDVAVGVKGQSFVQKFADLSQADISASVDDTGSALRGGNWQLEFSVGTTGTKLAFSGLALNTYSDLLADPADRAQTTLNLPADVMLGSSGTGTVTFNNEGLGNGYSPYVAVAFDATGTDSVNNSSEGITYKAGSARYLGQPVKEYILTFSGGQAVLTGLDNNGAATNIVFTLAQFPGMENGDQLVIFELPFGSFTPDQTAAQITFGFDVGSNADVAPGLDIVSRGFYRLGLTPTNDAGDPVVMGDAAIATLTPKIYTSSYNIITREEEQVAGENDAQDISYEVKIAEGQGVNGFRAEMEIPDNVVIDLANTKLFWEGVEIGGVLYKIVHRDTALEDVTAATPNAEMRPNGTFANAKLVAISTGTRTADGGGTDTFTLNVRYHVPRTAPDSPNAQDHADYIIDRETGADVTGTFDARSQFVWVPTDPDGDEGVVTITDNTLDARVLQWEAITIQKSVTGTSPNVLDDPVQNNDPLLGNPSNVAGAGAGDPEGVRSGDVITYTLDFQVSDYHGMRNVVITDMLADGLDIYQPDGTTFVDGPTLTFTANGQTLTLDDIDPANITVTNVVGGPDDGKQRIVINLSAELARRGIVGGDVFGDAFADEGADGLTKGSITYKARVLDEYRSAANGNPSNDRPWVNENDVFDTAVTISGTMLNNTGTLATPNVVAEAGTTSDDSGTSTTVKDGNLILEIYAVNGVLVSELPKDAAGNVLLSPGDDVSYRLRYQTTQADFTQLQLTAYLPDPYFRPADANADGTLDGAGNFTAAASGIVSGSSQPGADWAQAGKFALGPAAQNHPGVTTGGMIVTTTDPTDGNSIKFAFGDGNDTSNPGGDIGSTREVDVIFTVRLTNLPYASSLMTTAQANETSERSPNSGVTTPTPIQDNRLIQIALAAPSLQTSHGVVGKVTGEGGSVSGNTLPGGATVPGVGTTLPAETPTIGGLSPTNPITGVGQLNGNIGGLDAGDTMRMAMTIVNSGNGEAFQVETGAITAPPGYELRGGGTNLGAADVNFRVMRGDGTVLEQGVDWEFTAGGGIKLLDTDWVADDSKPFNGQLLGAFNDDGTPRTDGKNVIIITYDIVADNGAPSQAVATDNATSTATVVNYFGSHTSTNDYLPGTTVLSDTASLVVARPSVDIRWQGDATTIDRTVTADDSNQGHSSGGELVIGEMGYFDVKVTVPEGQTTNLFAEIQLPAGLSLDTSYNGGIGYEIITAAGTTEGQLDADFVGTGITTMGAGNITGLNGGTLGNTGVGARVALGTITNSADGNAANDSFIVRVRVRVDNVSSNQAGEQLNTTARAWFTDPDGASGDTGPVDLVTVDGFTGNDPQITIVEPTVTTVVTAQVVDIDPNTDGDQPGTQVDENGVVEYTITLTNTSTVKAWDLSLLDNLPPELLNDASLFISGITSSGAFRNGTGDTLTAADLSLNTATRTLTLNGTNAYDLDAGGTITIKIRGTVNETAAGKSSFNNTAETRWSSLDRSVPATGERTGADNLLNGTTTVNEGSGASSGTGVSQALTTGNVNNYRTASSAVVDVLALQPGLSRIGGLESTHLAPGAGTDTAAGSPTDSANAQQVTVGEVVRFRMVTRVPQGEVDQLTLTANLPPGYTYLGNATVALVSDLGMTAANVTGQMGDNTALTGSIQSDLSSTNQTRPVGTEPVGSITATMIDGKPVFQLGDVQNNDNDTDFEYVVIEFNVVVGNQAANQAGTHLDTNFTVSTGGPVSAGGTLLATSNTTRDVVAEPDIPTTKRVVDVQQASPQTGTNTITTEVSFTAGSGPNRTTAYDVVLTDAYGTNPRDYTLGVLTIGGTSYNLADPADRALATAAGISFTPADGAENTTGISISIPKLDPGTTVTLRYQTVVPTGDSQVADGTSSAVVTYSSLPETASWGQDPLAGSVFGSNIGGDGTATGERTGADGVAAHPSNPSDTTGPLNNYRVSDPAGYGTITGTLWDDTLDPDGQIDVGETLLEGVQVTLTWAGMDGVFGNDDDRLITTTTDSSGNYGFGALPGDDPATAGVNEGRYRITVASTVDVVNGADADTLTLRFDGVDGGAGGLNIGERALADGQAVTDQNFGYVQPNDAPVNQIGGSETFPDPDHPIEVTEDVRFPFTGPNQLTITDIDGSRGDGRLQTTLEVTNGTIEVDETIVGGAAVTVNGTSTTIVLVGTQAEINATLATLAFTPTNHFSGPAELRIITSDRGQGGDAGDANNDPRDPEDALIDEDVVYLNVKPVSDAPKLTVGTNGGQSTSPDAPGVGGGNKPTETVSGSTTGREDTDIPLGLNVVDADLNGTDETITSVKITNIPAGWQLVVGGTVVFTSTGPGDEYTAPDLATVPLLHIRPPAHEHGPDSAQLTITATSRDGDATVPTATTTGTLSVNVTPVNDRPEVDDTGGTTINLGTMPEGAPGSTPQTVQDLFGDKFIDPKDGAEDNGADSMIGVFIVGSAANAANEGHWQYSIDGGTTWTDVNPSTSDSSAIFLRNTDHVRFVPVDDNYAGTPGKLTVRLVENDQAGDPDVPDGAAEPTTIGSGLNTTPGSISDISAPVLNPAQFGTGRVSETLDAVITVTPASDAPRLTVGTGGGQATSPPTPGPGNGNNATEDVAGSTTGREDTDIPLGLNVESADPSTPETITLVTISGVPDGWKLVGGTTEFTSTGTGDVFTIPLADVPNLHIRPAAHEHGAASATLIVTATSQDGGATTATTTGTLTVNVTPVNDRPEALDPDTVSLGTVAEGAAASDSKTVGELFGTKFSDPKDGTEPNGADSMIGVFIVGSQAQPITQGYWEFSIDGGTTWLRVEPNPAITSDSSAIYLRNTDLIRFAPANADFSGTPGQLTVRLVENDQAGDPDVPDGAANSTTIGTALDTTPGGVSNIAAPVLDAAQFATGRVSEPVALVIQVTPVSDAPILTIGDNDGHDGEEPGNPPGTTGEQSSPGSATTGNHNTAVVTGSTRGDEDTSIPLGIRVESADRSDPETMVSVTITNVPAGWVLRDAAGVIVPTVGGSTGPLDPVRAAGLRITPPADLHSMGLVGTAPGATLTVIAESRDGTGTPVATTTGTLRIAVTPVNDRPVVDGPIAPDYLPVLPGNTSDGRTIESIFGPRYTDPRDTPELNGTDHFAGVAIIRTPPASQGIYQYSTDGGATWVSIAANTTAANAVVLTPTTLLRFVANPGFVGETQRLQAVLIETDRPGVNGDLMGRGGVPDDTATSAPPVAGTILDLSALEGNESAVIVGPGNSRFSLISAPMEVGIRVDPPITDTPTVDPYVPQKPLIPPTFNPVVEPVPVVYVGNAVQESQALAALEEIELTKQFESNLGNSGLQPNWIAPEGIPGIDPFVAPLPEVEAKVVEAAPPALMPRAAAGDDVDCARPRVVAKPRPAGEHRPAPRFKPGSEAARRFSEQLKRARARSRC